jgi:hypothetical protein
LNSNEVEDDEIEWYLSHLEDDELMSLLMELI